ncbi:solute symporter family protein [Leucobacter luti]|uniref:SSS family solute:Na+ symporter/cation/acetate symporter n=1 Tax=Leucobacter luti TaxID=340320 RepID=A0A4Q7U8M1_9MICO|nr:cation acetate symporter [Leucobacter luti]MBL3701001.1 cation acetate symporter [Leucobacter luti]RZT68778.1 SSS family solute:Na+ symporter/cation/acetate symporter [Leucobacter luti]
MDAVTIAIFVLLVAATLLITYLAAKRNRSAADHLVAGGRISGRQNGLAIAGDFISAASFLGVTGAIALSGFNGFYLAVFVPVAFVLALLLVAEPLRNLGKFTLADVLATRYPARNVRAMMATTSVVISLVYLVAQLVGAALLISLMFGLPYWAAVLAIGGLTTVYTLLGGMVATTWIQIVKTGILLICAAVLFVFVIGEFDFNPLRPFADVMVTLGDQFVAPHRGSGLQNFDQLSMTIGLVFGVLGLPHVMIRFLTVPNARQARSSAYTSIWVFFVFYAMVPVLGYAATLLVGADAITARNPGGNLAVMQLAEAVGGKTLLAIIAAVAFVTILAALSGLVIATSGAIAHDLYGQVLRRGNVTAAAQLRAARIATLATSIAGVAVAFAAERQNVAFLASLGMSIAAAANLPALMLTMYWKRMTSAAVVAGMSVGLGVSIAVILLSPIVWGETALLGFSNPALVAAPVALGTSLLVALSSRHNAGDAERASAAYSDMRAAAFGPQRASLVGGDGSSAAQQPAAVARSESVTNATPVTPREEL